MMGCGLSKSSANIPTKADILELQKHPEELNEKRIKILQWMADGSPQKMDDQDKVTEKVRPVGNNWQEAWQREQELVAHPSRIDSCKSKMLCITMVNEKLRLACDDDHDDDTEPSWNALESLSQ